MRSQQGLDLDSLVYDTGDRAQILPDGNLEFLGRRDDQVKINGFRIEPAEVEAGLSACPTIEKVCVTARRCGDKEGTCGKQLVAYYTVAARLKDKGGNNANEEAIRRFARISLPHYMIPAFLVEMDSFQSHLTEKLTRVGCQTLLRYQQ